MIVDVSCRYCDGLGVVPEWEHLPCGICEGDGIVNVDLRDRYVIQDALEATSSLPAESIDLIVTDPAYDTLEKWRNMGTTTRLSKSKSSSNDWFDVVDMSYLNQMMAQWYRVLKPNTHFYLFSDYETHLVMAQAARAVGFELKKPLIWEKVGKYKPIHCPACHTEAGQLQSRGAPGMGYPYRSCYEMVLFAQKGKRPMPEDKGVRDVLRYENLRGKGLYPTQKPVDLIEVLIKQSSDPGALVLDSFAGSGATLVAARNTGRHYLGFDISKDAKEFFEGRAEGDRFVKEASPETPVACPPSILDILKENT